MVWLVRNLVRQLAKTVLSTKKEKNRERKTREMCGKEKICMPKGILMSESTYLV